MVAAVRRARVVLWEVVAVALVAATLLLAPPARAAAPSPFDGDPATTERILEGDPLAAAILLSGQRFAGAGADGRHATHAVLSRDDAFADSLAAAALTATAPLLFTPHDGLAAATRAELDRVLDAGAVVYLLGGPAALSHDVEDALRADGYQVRRLAGSSRVETALAVADEVRRRHAGAGVLLARAYGHPDAAGSDWADSVSAGGFAAARGLPVLLTPTGELHPAVAAWLRADTPDDVVLLGGRAALSDAVMDAAGDDARRVSGAERTATAAAIATELWSAPTSGSRRFVVVNGEHPQGWAFGLAGAGAAADDRAPVLLVTGQVTAATGQLVSTCGQPQVDLLVLGDGGVVSGGAREHLDFLDGRACGRGGALTLASNLSQFSDCGDTLEYFRSAAVERVGPFGLFGFGPIFGGPVVTDDTSGGEEGAGSAPMPAPATAPAAEHSGTNVQEEGVDEPDIVKTNGRISVAIAQNRFQVVDLTGDAPRLAGSLDLPGYGHSLFLSGTWALVFSDAGFVFAEPVPEPGPGGEDAVASPGIDSPDAYEPRTVLTLVDLTDATNPTVRETLAVDGHFRSARMVDGIARVVVHAPPQELSFSYPKDDSREAYQQAAEHNRDVVANSTLNNWLPSYERVDANGTSTEARLVSCADVAHPPAFSGFGTLSVFTVDVGGALTPLSSAAVTAGGEVVYGSRNGLYVTTSRWYGGEPNFAPEAVSTEVHAFDVTDPAATRYRASGRVSGVVLNQFSLSEHNGHLRVATTDQPVWGDPDGVSQSAVTVLAEQDGALVPVGRVDGLGVGERIYAVRFMGDLGAVVTFRQVDPLYLLDLSDPVAPRVLGELKVPGFSSYLHRVGENLLLGVGQDATEEGRVTGAQVSLFDISDRANPQRVAQVQLGQGHSEVESDHRAFLYWPASNLAVLPLLEYTETGPGFNGAVGVQVDPAAGALREIGRVDHTADSGQDSQGDEDFWLRSIRRSFVVGDRLYTLSEQGLVASDLETLAREAEVTFSQQ